MADRLDMRSATELQLVNVVGRGDASQDGRPSWDGHWLPILA